MTDWLDTPEGKAFEDLSGRVYDILDVFKLDAEKRFFVDGKQKLMSLDQVIQKLADDLEQETSVIREFVLMWMYEASNALDPEFEGTQEHVDIAQNWADDECQKYGIVLRF
ncbi:MAG: hypothetical protein HYW48_01360 [Deltaproteobacteria bacterium]|nr:hypothetical protein [Deltaproteobacteria bacterium]